jgi:hypothetical protein
LLEAGLISEIRLPPLAAEKENSQPVKIDGPPLSETIIQERR